MLQCNNQTPFAVGLFAFPDERGESTLYLVVKATFALRGNVLGVAEAQRPVVVADEYWGEAGRSSLKYAGEAHLLKPATDVVLVGDAHAPGARPVSSLLVSLRVGAVRKQIRVFGERVWQGRVAPHATAAEPFVQMPLVYERAFGGAHETERGGSSQYPRNPVGRGFGGQRRASEIDGMSLPNLEDPEHPIQSPSDLPIPAAPGFVAPGWAPRTSYAGTYDEAWRTTRAPYLPLDFQPRYFQAAHPDLIHTGHLVGGEPVELTHVSPAGPSRFLLPECDFEVLVRIAGRIERPRMQMETVLLEPGEERVGLLWRGAVACDKRPLRMEQAWFKLQSMRGVA